MYTRLIHVKGCSKQTNALEAYLSIEKAVDVQTCLQNGLLQYYIYTAIYMYIFKYINKVNIASLFLMCKATILVNGKKERIVNFTLLLQNFILFYLFIFYSFCNEKSIK